MLLIQNQNFDRILYTYECSFNYDINHTKSSIGNSIPDMQLKSTHQSHRRVNNRTQFCSNQKQRKKINTCTTIWMYLSCVNWRTANFDGGFKLEQIGLLEKDFPGSNTELFDLRLRELDLLPRPRQSDLREPSDDVIEHGRVHPSLPLRGHSIRFSDPSPNGSDFSSAAAEGRNPRKPERENRGSDGIRCLFFWTTWAVLWRLLSCNCAFVWASAFGVWWVYFSLGDYIIAFLFYFSWKKRVGIRKGKEIFGRKASKHWRWRWLKPLCDGGAYKIWKEWVGETTSWSGFYGIV